MNKTGLHELTNDTESVYNECSGGYCEMCRDPLPCRQQTRGVDNMKKELKKTAALFKMTREVMKFSQKDMAEVLDVKQPDISRYELGENNPPGNITVKVMEMYFKQTGKVPKL